MDLIVRGWLVELERALVHASVTSYGLMLDLPNADGMAVVELAHLVNARSAIGEAQKSIADLGAILIQPASAPRVILHWGPVDSGIRTGSRERAKSLGLSVNVVENEVPFEHAGAASIIWLDDLEAAIDTALAYHQFGQGVLIVEYESATMPECTVAFDEITQFPKESRS